MEAPFAFSIKCNLVTDLFENMVQHVLNLSSCLSIHYFLNRGYWAIFLSSNPFGFLIIISFFFSKFTTQPKLFWSSVQESAAAFVFFKTRYAAAVAAQVLQFSNPMLWVTNLAPEPHDVYWSNLCIPYKQLWIRKIGTLVATIAFMFVFLIPVTFVQGLTQLDQLQQTFPFLRGLLKK